MQLSHRQETFSQFFSSFLKSPLNFQYFEKKKSPSEILYFRYYGLQKRSQINV